MRSVKSEPAQAAIPVSVITGFLGSGKTTLLSRLLADPRMNKAAVIINEFGEVGLDHVLVTAPREDVVLLSSGCLCCSLRGDLVNTLASLYGERARGEIPAFDRVLVETTGLADPAPVLLTVTGDPDLSELFCIDRVITTVDAVHGLGQLDDNPESVKQACVADVLVITKTDIAGAGAIEALEARLKQLNPIAQTYRVVQGAIEPDWLFNFGSAWTATRRDIGCLVEHLENTAVANGAHGPHHHDHDHDADTHAGIRSFSVIREDPVTPAGLQVWMGLLGDFHGPSLLRIKGIVNIDNRPIVIQAVQHMVHPLTELPDWPDEDRCSRIVFITRGIAREQIERTLDVLSLDLAARSQEASPIDPEAFRKFAAAAARFR